MTSIHDFEVYTFVVNKVGGHMFVYLSFFLSLRAHDNVRNYQHVSAPLSFVMLLLLPYFISPSEQVAHAFAFAFVSLFFICSQFILPTFQVFAYGGSP